MRRTVAFQAGTQRCWRLGDMGLCGWKGFLCFHYTCSSGCKVGDLQVSENASNAIRATQHRQQFCERKPLSLWGLDPICAFQKAKNEPR